ncbi:MAG TPA: response regulator transcription factor [Thermoanaerobaculia bacterium]|nr:response regulator transcription factor [Thermoanaerobaculia bacterium]
MVHPIHCWLWYLGHIWLFMPEPIRIAILSGDRMFREVLTLMLAGRVGLEVIAVAGEAEPANADPCTVDVVLVDAASEPKLALSRVRAAWARFREAQTVVLGLAREDESVGEYVEAGAHAYVLQGASPEGLVRIVRDVHERKSPSSPRVLAEVLRRIASLSRPPAAPPRLSDPLTPREEEILALLARGLGNKEICQRLHITVQTVKNHVHAILTKLQVHRRREAVRLAYETGLLAEPGEIPETMEKKA